jgi:hypothetical protein
VLAPLAPVSRPAGAGGFASHGLGYAEPHDNPAATDLRARVSAISAGGRLAFGLCADPAAVHDVDALASGLGRELDELLART